VHLLVLGLSRLVLGNLGLQERLKRRKRTGLILLGVEDLVEPLGLGLDDGLVTSSIPGIRGMIQLFSCSASVLGLERVQKIVEVGCKRLGLSNSLTSSFLSLLSLDFLSRGTISHDGINVSRWQRSALVHRSHPLGNRSHGSLVFQRVSVVERSIMNGLLSFQISLADASSLGQLCVVSFSLGSSLVLLGGLGLV
jgi:hypothetical protein